MRPRVRDMPSVGAVMPLITFSRVLFPAPFEPTMPSTSPSCTSSDTCRNDHSSLRMGGATAYPGGESRRGLTEVGALAVVLAEPIPLAQALDLDDGCAHQITSANSRSWARNDTRARRNTTTATPMERPNCPIVGASLPTTPARRRPTAPATGLT